MIEPTAMATKALYEFLKTYIYAVYLAASEVAVPSLPHWPNNHGGMTVFADGRKGTSMGEPSLALRHPYVHW